MRTVSEKNALNKERARNQIRKPVKIVTISL